MTAKKAKPDATMALAENLVRVLQSQRQQGAAVYPLLLADLARRADPQANSTQVLAATRKGAFKDRALVAKSPSGKFTAADAMRAPVSLLEDVDQLARWPRTLELALRAKRTKTMQAHSVTALAGALATKLKEPFKQACNEQLAMGLLPPTVAYVLDRTPKLFLVDDLQPAGVRECLEGRSVAAKELDEARQPPEESLTEWEEDRLSQPLPVGSAFAARFDEAFARLDRQKGGHNFISLLSLRNALVDVPRPSFDAGLRVLRVAGRYGLSAAESAYGLSPEERQAGIEEAGSLLLYVSRKTP